MSVRFATVCRREQWSNDTGSNRLPRIFREQKELMPSRRTILSIIRTVVYGCIAVALALWHGEIRGNTDAVLVGAVCGDYLTWLVWSVIELPENLLHGCYDVCVNTLFGLLVYRMADINLSADMNGEFVAVMFLAFLLVTGVKVFYLGVVFMEEGIEDDE